MWRFDQAEGRFVRASYPGGVQVDIKLAELTEGVYGKALSFPKPSHQIMGKSTRYDVFMMG